VLETEPGGATIRAMAPGTLKTARIVAAKELRSCLRDPQTLIYALLLPLALYPALFWVMIQVSSLIEGRRALREVRIEVIAETAAEADAALALVKALSAGQLSADGSGDTEAAADDSAPGDAGTDSLRVLAGPHGLDVDACVDRLRNAADARANAGGDSARGAAPPADAVLLVRSDPNAPLLLLKLGTRPDSELAAARVEARLAELAAAARENAARAHPDPVVLRAPLAVVSRDLSSGAQQGAYLISVMLPMFVILMAVFGAFYPAVDLTAGERERKSEETTLLAPAPRGGLWLGKLLAVAALSFAATLLNLFGIAFAANHLLAMLGADGIEVRLGLVEIALAMPYAAVLVLLVAAILTGLGSLTQTFKQGQSLLGGAQLVFMLPALASSLPGLALSPGLAATPIVGIALALRMVLRGGELEPVGLLIAFASHLVYALVATFAALRLMGVELDADGRAPGLARVRAALLPRKSLPRRTP